MNKQTQNISFANDFSQQEYRVFEVPDELLQIILEKGEFSDLSLQIKGGNEQAAILCTDSKTYALTRVETSNTLFLANDNEISGAITCHFEAVAIIPNLRQQLQTLLPVIHDTSAVTASKLQQVTLKALEKRIAASTQEIQQALTSMCALQIHSKYILFIFNQKQMHTINWTPKCATMCLS